MGAAAGGEARPLRPPPGRPNPKAAAKAAATAAISEAAAALPETEDRWAGSPELVLGRLGERTNNLFRIARAEGRGNFGPTRVLKGPGKSPILG